MKTSAGRPEPDGEEDRLASLVVQACFEIHRELGPGLLESVYERILARKLEKAGCRVRRQWSLSFEFEGEVFGEGFHADLLVNDSLIVELKSVEAILPVHKKQVLTYLRLAKLRLRLLINFGEALLRDGIHRILNNRWPPD